MNDQICAMLGGLDINSDNFPLIIVFGVGGILGLTGIVFGSICSIYRERQRQQTKREVAAYVAEGSITPEDAERIIRANEGKKA